MCLDSLFFLLKLMKLSDTKYEKYANLAPSFYCLCCHAVPAGKKTMLQQETTAGGKHFHPSTHSGHFAVLLIVHIKAIATIQQQRKTKVTEITPPSTLNVLTCRSWLLHFRYWGCPKEVSVTCSPGQSHGVN